MGARPTEPFFDLAMDGTSVSFLPQANDGQENSLLEGTKGISH